MFQNDDPDLGVAGWPAHLVRAEATIVRRTPWQPSDGLVVDLGENIGSVHWWRGVTTLSALVAALIAVAPTLQPRPLALRASFPVAVAPPAPRAVRVSTPLRSRAAPATVPIVANGPIRLTGVAGGGLYRALLDRGAAPSVAADFLHAIATRIDLGTIASTDRFELVVAPADGGARLLYAGILHRGQPLSLLRWTVDGQEGWFDAAGVGPPGDGLTVPVADARLSSGFGMRFHPILGFSRMHQGVDLAAPYGTPIVAAAEGIVRFAGAHGGYGNFVQVQHDGGLGTGYGHMSAIVVRPGAIVRQGELLGYVGSTGMSTGPHCHFEVYRNGVAIDPITANFAVAPILDGEDLARFRATLARVAALPVSEPSSRT